MKIVKILLVVAFLAVSALYIIQDRNANPAAANEGPVIRCDAELIEISVHDDDSVILSGVTATDAQDGDLTGQVLVSGFSKLITDNTAKVTYVVFDSDDNMATCSRLFRYTDYVSPTFTVTSPLIYPAGASMLLLDRLKVTDVLDGDITNSLRVTPMRATDDPEIYTIDLQVTNSMGDTVQLTLPVIQQESSLNRAEVVLSSTLVYLDAGTTFRADNYLRSVSTPAGWADPADVEISGSVNTATPGTYMVIYEYRSEKYTGTSVLTVVVQ